MATKTKTLSTWKLSTYCPGPCAGIVFVWTALEEGRRVATGRKVLPSEARRHFNRSRDCQHFRRKGYRLVKLCDDSTLVIVPNIERIDDRHLRFNNYQDGKPVIFEYEIGGDAWLDGTIRYHDLKVWTTHSVDVAPMPQRYEVKHSSTLGSIVHFLNHEAALAACP